MDGEFSFLFKRNHFSLLEIGNLMPNTYTNTADLPSEVNSEDVPSQAWKAPVIRWLDVAENTRNAASVGDDGMGIFTHS